jgi:hypothetical protein
MYKHTINIRIIKKVIGYINWLLTLDGDATHFQVVNIVEVYLFVIQYFSNIIFHKQDVMGFHTRQWYWK